MKVWPQNWTESMCSTAWSWRSMIATFTNVMPAIQSSARCRTGRFRSNDG